MANQVIKKDGTKQPFDPEKIKKAIAIAADRAGVSEEKRNEVVEQVSSSVIALTDTEEEIATSEIREKILSELDQVEPSISAGWRKYDQEQKGV